MGFNVATVKRGCLIAGRILSVLLILWWTFYVVSSHGVCAIYTIESLFPLLVLLVTSVAWNRHLMGGFLFIFLGLLNIGWMWGCMYFDTLAYVFGPLFLAGILFVAAGAINNSRSAGKER